ncbi:MAG TPA: Yip1 family protein [Gaiellaceae bacterium]|nr:Yip1 family protein [Gaiellaceae bacterium]
MRDWWLRTLLVLQRPRPVFVALRDDSREAVADRAEPILLVVWLSGIAAVLADAATYLDDPSRDGVDLAVWAFFAGGIIGGFAYFVLGGILYAAVKVLGSQGSYRRARHVLAFALVPVALSLLVLWPVKLALYGEDWFRTGGRDAGAGGAAFDLVTFGFFVWSAALLAVGVRSVHGWTWPRAFAATAVALAVPIGFSILAATV